MSPAATVEELYLHARDDVYYYVLTLGLSPGQAQEVAQEAFLRLYTTVREGTAIDNPRAWIFRVAHNLALKTRARERDGAPLPEHFESTAAHPGANPERELIDEELRRRLQAALAELSPQQRQCLHLRAEGLRYHEIAAALGVGTSTVGEFLSRAMNKLRKVLK